MKEKHDREAFKFLLGENQIGPYLAQRKLTLVEHLAPAEIERQYLTGDRGASITRIPGYFHFVVAAK